MSAFAALLLPLLHRFVSRWSISFAGVAVVALLVWNLDPRIPAVGTSFARGTAVLMLLIAWAGVNGGLDWRRGRRERAQAAAADAGEETAGDEGTKAAADAGQPAGSGTGAFELPWQALIGRQRGQDVPPPSPTGWLEANQAYLLRRLAGIKGRLEQHAGRAAAGRTPAVPAMPSLNEQAAFADRPPALAALASAFGLSPFECDVLLLCAGMELDASIPALCAAAQGDPARPYPTFSLALAMLPQAHWSALSPESPLRHWLLIEIGTGPVLTRSSLRIDERVLHYLVGISELDERLGVLIDPLPPVEPDALAPSQAVLAEQVAQTWVDASPSRDLTVVQMRGSVADCRPVAAAAAAMLGLRAASLHAERLPSANADLDSMLRLWEREAVLSDLGVLLVDCDDTLQAEGDAARTRFSAVSLLLERATGAVILRESQPRRITHRAAKMLEIDHPTRAEQIAVWQAALGDRLPDPSALDAAAAQFSLSLPAIRTIAAEALAATAPPPEGGTISPPDSDVPTVVWDLCRRHLRSALDGLAQRIESNLHWDDLVLPAEQKQTLRTIAAQLRQRGTVYDRWGFADKSRRGLGISALFHGPSGTGKTMAAEVLASELQVDLYHIDLSRIVSKFIGETEANLRRVFDAAEQNGAILLFDEADSLFGTRSQVKDSHDRYANIEVSYLLQRMEAYRGLAVLTTNMRTALDPAFPRRIRFAVQFPFPDARQRAAIWRQVFPAAASTLDLDADRLARLNIAGGNIRNIALNAAFLAAGANEPVQMHHLRDATRAEYAKLERRLTQAESEAWA
jgi:AAA+ superfamily predicted ATPase